MVRLLIVNVNDTCTTHHQALEATYDLCLKIIQDSQGSDVRVIAVMAMGALAALRLYRVNSPGSNVIKNTELLNDTYQYTY